MASVDAGNVAAAGLQSRSRFDFTPEVLASYPRPNYDDPVTRGPLLYIFNSIFFTCMLFCVGIRLYSRIFIRKWFGWDDVFIITAVVGAVGVTACIMLGFHEFGWDRHIYDIRLHLLEPSGKILFASKVLWYFTSNSVRASVMCLYYRLLDQVGANQYRWVLHVNTVFILGLFITQISTTVFACSPIKSVWTYPPIPTKRCIDRNVALFTNSVLNTFSEAVVAALPLAVILSLNFTSYQRRITISLLCGGFLVVTVGCVRCYYVWMTIVTHDPSWWSTPHWICSEVEMDVAIVCACAPAVTPVLSRIFRGGLSAAKQTDPSFPSAPSPYRTQRARSLFGRLKDQSSVAALSVSTTRSDASNERLYIHKDIDLEGISNDGFGYSVTITTGRGTKVKRRWDIRNKTWHYYPEEPVSDFEDEISTANEPKKRPIFSSGSMRKKSSQEMAARDLDIPIMGVQTEKTFDVRESFYSEKFDRGFDHRNPYKNDMAGKFEEIEIALQIPEVEANDWSLFDGEVNRRMAARILPDAEVRHQRTPSREQAIPSPPTVPAPAASKRRPTSYDAQRHSTQHNRRSLDSIRPLSESSRVTGVHRVSQSQHDLHVGVLPSPSTHGFERPVHPSLPSTPALSGGPSPIPSPLPARLPGEPTAARPRNLSDVWAISPGIWQFPTSFIRSNTPSPDGSAGDSRTTAASAQAAAKSRPRIRPGRSSFIATGEDEDSSGDNVIAQSQRLQPPQPQGYDEASDDEFSLPLQRPSPRNSGYNLRSQETTPSVPAIRVREYG